LPSPVFFSEEAILATHADLIEVFGGPQGYKYELVCSIAAYPRQKLAYARPTPTIPELAGFYGWGIARFHAFADGNKRVAFTLMGMFLLEHGFDFDIDYSEAEQVLLDAAAEAISEDDFVEWVVSHVVEVDLGIF
jgi:death-on-curing protein